MAVARKEVFFGVGWNSQPVFAKPSLVCYIKSLLVQLSTGQSVVIAVLKLASKILLQSLFAGKTEIVTTSASVWSLCLGLELVLLVWEHCKSLLAISKGIQLKPRQHCTVIWDQWSAPEGKHIHILKHISKVP